MSHYTVLIIGENPEKQLEPFWELDLSRKEMLEDQRAVFVRSFRKMDLKKEFEKFKEKHKKELEELEKDYWKKYKTCSAIEWIKDWSGEYLNKEGTHYGYYHNPNAKWDWFSLGGRWIGFFKLKKGKKGETGQHGIMTESPKIGTCDQARKGDIDFSKKKEVSTYAVLKDGEWFESGRMGWWGISEATEKQEKEFKKGFYAQWIKDLPDDTLLSVYDCHI